MRKKLLIAIVFLCVMLAAAACGKSGENNSPSPTGANSAVTPTAEATSTPEATPTTEATPTPEATPTTEATPTPEATPTTEPTPTQVVNVPEHVLVVVFSVTGNTKKVAEMVAKIENADLYEIIPAEPYTSEDINYSNYNCRALKEQNNAAARPEIGSETIDLSGYTKIYVGYPIWATNEPRIMDTFVEKYDFGKATVIPFCTSGSSGIGTTGIKLAKLAGSGNWQPGKRFPGSATEKDVQSWIDGMEPVQREYSGETYSISYDLSELGSLAEELTVLPESARSGEIAEIRSNAVFDAGMHIYLDGRELKITHYDSDYWGWAFVMPERNVTITAKPFTKSEIWGG